MTLDRKLKKLNMHTKGKIIGIGLIGAGGAFGTFIQSCLKDVEGAALVAISDVNKVALEKARQNLKIWPESAYQDWRELVDDPDVHLVIVATPPFTQAAIAHGVLSAGKALFLEKPGAITLTDMQELVVLQNEMKAPAVIDYVMRANPLLDLVRTVSASQYLGALRSIQFLNYAQDLAPDHWFWDSKKSGGIWVEHGVHFIDLYGAIAGGAPQSISSSRVHRSGTKRVDTVSGSVVHDNGVVCDYFHAFNRPAIMEKQQAVLAFDRGFITVSGWIADRVEIEGNIDRASADALLSLPHLVAKEEQSFYKPLTLSSSDLPWQADLRFSARYELRHDRNETYRLSVAANLSSLVQTLISSTDHTSHKAATLSDAYRSLAVACALSGTASITDVKRIYSL